MKKLFVTISAILFCGSVFAEPKTFTNPGKMPAVKDKNRPSVALVLSGGGINGAAEIPVLEALEKYEIPVDIVLGTSIGAIVGGLYSAGYTTDQIYEQFFAQNWPEIFADFSPSVYEKLYEEHGTSSNLLPLKAGLDAKLQTGKGVSNGQKAYEMLKELTLKYPSDTDFDNLPVPFRCFATDMITGEPYMFSQGDLAEAIRSSMNVAGLFEPLCIDGHYLLDGGLTCNLPVSIAKKMGYDIVIAVEIGPDSHKSERTYDSNPLYTLQDSIYIPMKTLDKIEGQAADLVISPDMSGFEVTDFNRAREIYQEGQKAVQANQAAFEALHNRIYPKENNYAQKQDLYSPLQYLYPATLKTVNAYKEDEKYIAALFKRYTNDNCSIQAYKTFVNGIYKTGHYKLIQTRIIQDAQGQLMEVHLTQKPEASILFLAGIDVQQTAAHDNHTSFSNANLALQFRGITNADSLLSIRGTFLNDWDADFMFFQPLTKNCYLKLQSQYEHQIYGTYEQFIFWNNNLRFGLNYMNHAYIENGLFYNLSRIPVDFAAKEKTSMWEAGACIKYSFSILDQPCFSQKGLAIDAIGKYIVPVQGGLCFEDSSLTGKINVKAAIPFGAKFSAGIETFAGWDFTGNLNKNKELVALEGNSNYDRVYFPQNCQKNSFSPVMFAGSLTLQYAPVEALTIAGGKLYLLANGTWGTLGRFDEGIWSASAGFGLRILDSCNLMVRAGAASTQSSNCVPFVTLDLGSLNFQRF